MKEKAIMNVLKGDTRVFLSRMNVNIPEAHKAMISVHVALKDHPGMEAIFTTRFLKELYREREDGSVDIDGLKEAAGNITNWNNIWSLKYVESATALTHFLCPQGSMQYGFKTERLPGTPEDYGLPPLKIYDNGKITRKLERTGRVSDEMLAEYEKEKPYLHIITGLAPGCSYDESKSVFFPTFGVKIYCDMCGETKEKTGCFSLCCNNSKNSIPTTLIDLTLKKFLDDIETGYFEVKMKKSSKSFLLRFVCPQENGLKISMVSSKIQVRDGILKESIDVIGEAVYEIGKGVKAYMPSSDGMVETDIERSGILETPDKTVYSGCGSNLEQFLLSSDEKVFRAMGFLDLLKSKQGDWYSMDNVFFVYISALSYFPQIEQLIKVGWHVIYDEIAHAIRSGNFARLEDYKKLIDVNGTTDKNSIRVPKYVMDYLVAVDANIEDMLGWVAIYELTGLSKEQFEDIVNSREFIMVSLSVPKSEMADILKYGYDFKKLLRYILKQTQFTEHGMDIRQVCDTLYDYLFMCEVIGVEPDKYPADLQKQHDNLVVVYNSKKVELDDQTLLKTAESLERCYCEAIARKYPEELEGYSIVFPESTKDFIEEGNKQRNCVASHAKMVLDKQCYVYFLRRDDKPDESFITAEYTPTGGQFKFAHNQEVRNGRFTAIRKFMNKVIEEGIEDGKLEKLKKW